LSQCSCQCLTFIGAIIRFSIVHIFFRVCARVKLRMQIVCAPTLYKKSVVYASGIFK
jgi:hypothetical protein